MQWRTRLRDDRIDQSDVERPDQRVAFYIGKARFYDRFRGAFNERQEKALGRMFREGPSGFKGGLSAENYISITRTSRATATRDLHDLVEQGALTRTGERRHTRYWLNLPELQSTPIRPATGRWTRAGAATVSTLHVACG
jgi:Fic family protein